MKTVRELRVFVSSPGDVKKERDAVREVIEQLNDNPEWRDEIRLKAYVYDHPDFEVPMEAGRTPQDSVNRYLLRPSACDIIILILWGRLGTPLADVTRPDGSRYESGTVWELEDAQAQNRPVFVYRRDQEPKATLGNRANVAEAQAQYDAVQAFFQQRFKNADGSAAGGVNPYKTVPAFKKKLAGHLRVFVQSIRSKGTGDGAGKAGDTIRMPYMAPDHDRLDYDLVRRTDPQDPKAPDDVAAVWAKVAAGHDVCLTFLPGVGKSTLAEEVVAQREKVLEHFDGVLWADVGRRPEPLEQLRHWADAMDISFKPADAGGMAGLQDAEAIISRAIGQHRMLVVLDDVWEKRHAREYRRLGVNCVYLITTRVRALAQELVKAGDVFPVREFTTAEGFALLKSLAPAAVEVDAGEVRNLVRLVRGLPLALVLMGKFLKNAATDPNDRQGIAIGLGKLRQAGELLKASTDASKDSMTMAEIIGVSFDALSAEGQRALPRLSILRSKPHGFTEEMVRDICKVDPQVIRADLVPMGLVEFKSNNDFTIHPIIAAYGMSKLSPQRRKEMYRSALAWYGSRLTGAIDADPDSYADWYRYEKADWQATKDNWLFYLAACGNDAEAMLAFLRVFFDAFWWWGYYQRFPFCVRLIREWQLRALGEQQRRGLAELLLFHDNYPEGPVKSGHGERWRRVEGALTQIRRGLGLDGVYEDIERGDARRVRSFLDFFLAECWAYGHGDRAGALARYTAAHDEFVQDGVPWVPAWIWFYVGQYMLDVDDPGQALLYTQRALDEAGEQDRFEKRDPELLANIYRALGDLHLQAGDEDGAGCEYGRALCYAFAFQAVPEPPDTYTVEFYREVTGRISEALVQARVRSVEVMLRVARRLHRQFDPWWAVAGSRLDDVALMAAAGSDAATLQARLFPAVPSKDEVGEGSTAADFRARLLPTLDALCAAASIAQSGPR